MKIWILTKEWDDYDQRGECFLHAFHSKPTPQQLVELCGMHENDDTRICQIGGGREKYEDVWYNLYQETLK